MSIQGKLTLKDGVTIKATDGIEVLSGGGHLVVQGGKVDGTVTIKSSGYATISGGTFTGLFTLNNPSQTKLSGGTFNGGVKHVNDFSDKLFSYLATGYVFIPIGQNVPIPTTETKNYSNTDSYSRGVQVAKCTKNTHSDLNYSHICRYCDQLLYAYHRITPVTYYTDFSEAWNPDLYWGSPTSLVLLRDVTVNGDLTVTESFTLDLNGHTLTANKLTVNSGKTLTLNDDHSGTLKVTSLEIPGTFTFEDDTSDTTTTVQCTGNAIVGGTLNMASNTALSASGGITVSGALNIAGGNVTGAVTVSGGNATISGGTFANLFTQSGGTVTISGGTFSSGIKTTVSGGKVGDMLKQEQDVYYGFRVASGSAITWYEKDATAITLSGPLTAKQVPIQSLSIDLSGSSAAIAQTSFTLVPTTIPTIPGSSINFTWTEVNGEISNSIDPNSIITTAGEHTYRVSATLDGYTKTTERTITVSRSDMPASITSQITAPTAKTNLVYNRGTQILISAGAVPETLGSNYRMEYKLGTNDDWKTDANQILGKNAAEGSNAYKVYYRIVPINNDVGDYKAYECPTPVSVTISKATPTLTVDPISKTYDGEAVLASSITGTAIFDNQPIAGSWSWQAGENVINVVSNGSRTVVFTPTDQVNYNITTTALTLTIETRIVPIPITPSAEDSTFTYDGTSKTYPLATSSWYTITGATQTNANETGYTVTASLNSPANMKWSDDSTKNKTYTFYILKVTPTGEPQYTAINTNGKTLADAALVKTVTNLTTGGFSVPGTVKWVDENGDELPDSTQVVANIAYKWVFTPTDSINYNSLTDSIIFYYSATTFPVATAETENGTVTITPKRAERGDTITITVTPDAGYTLETLTVIDRNGNEIKLTPKGDGKYTFKMPENKVTITATFTKDNSLLNFFVDITTDKYYYNAVLWATKNGITGGIDENHFGPNLSCTRAQLVTFLWRAAGCPVTNYTLDFNDVGDNYYTEAVRWATSLGIVDGYGNGLFGSDDSITRQQTATILYRFAIAMGMDVSVGEDTNILSYTDALDIAEYAMDAFQWACGTGILQGSNGSLMPNDDCIRGQIVTMLYRLLGE